jgi:hypothetical protein
MAQSPSHKLGQIIGDMLEAAIREPLAKVASEYGLFLDYKHPRKTRDDKRKVAWTDHKGNSHDLDYVLEEGGSETVQGKPRAFVEIAWRRYTKHSRNKTQEIQGAIGPLAETYHSCRPFLGAVLAGVFTEGSLTQLRSHGFTILYFPYESIVAAFQAVGVDVTFDESTSDADLSAKVAAYEALSVQKKTRIAKVLRTTQSSELEAFCMALLEKLGRKIEAVVVFPLYGTPEILPSLAEAITFLKTHPTEKQKRPLVRFELLIRYTNGDDIRATFQDRDKAIEFLDCFT